VDTVVTRCRDRETDKKRVTEEIYDAGDARQRNSDVEHMAARWCHGRENAHKLAAAENLVRPKYSLSSFLI
jgi:hypothetical protein